MNKVNPFAGGGGDAVETEEKSWKRVTKTEWVHLELVEVCLYRIHGLLDFI